MKTGWVAIGAAVAGIGWLVFAVQSHDRARSKAAGLSLHPSRLIGEPPRPRQR